MTGRAQTARIGEAAAFLERAHRDATRPAAFPDDFAPASPAEALEIQGQLVQRLGETIAGWKVGAEKDGTVLYGAIVGSRMLQSPAVIPPDAMPLRGVEAEIAFRFDRTLPARAAPYGYDEIRDSVTAHVVIEIVDSRFASYRDAPFDHRLADFMSNGALVVGTERSDWRDFDLTGIEAALLVDGAELHRGSGGHTAGDPLLPAVALANQITRTGDVPMGAFMTTGTYSGLNFVSPGARVEARFEGFGTAEVRFD